jgi:hypothetical protein
MKKAAPQSKESPLKDALAMLHRIVGQDTEPDPPSGRRRIKEGVAHERIISIGDPEMRHGRKSRTKRIDGYKRHIAVIDNVIVATAVEPANLREHEPTERPLESASRHGELEVLDIDRGYLPSPAVGRLHREGVAIHARTWNPSNHGRFTKADFRIDLRRKRVTCPNGSSARIIRDRYALFDAEECSRCPIKTACTRAPQRSLSIHRDEALMIKLRKAAKTRAGRSELRERVHVEHRLARVSAIQGNRARYRGARRNELDLNRAVAVANLLEVEYLRAA